MKTIVTMTSFPARINIVPKVIKSMMRQTAKPDKIVLYLAKSQFPDKKLPDSLTNLVGDMFEIRWTNDDIRSYKKLVPALTDFPNDILITVDDDVRYLPNTLARMLAMHKKHPDSVIANRAKKIDLTAPYRKWKLRRLFNLAPTFSNIATGCGGILYPPHSLHPDATDRETFAKIAPSTDDLWFWAMAARNGTKLKVVPNPHVLPHNLANSQKEGLRHVNFRHGNTANDTAFAKIIETYPELNKAIAA